MFEHIVQMGPMLVLAGVMAGWVAEVVSRADGHGFIRDMVLGLVGSVVGAVTVWVVISSEAGMLAMFLVGCGGAMLAIVAQRRFWGSSLTSRPRRARGKKGRGNAETPQNNRPLRARSVRIAGELESSSVMASVRCWGGIAGVRQMFVRLRRITS